MNLVLRFMIEGLDLTVHPEIKKRGGIGLVRARMLSMSSVLMGAASACLLIFLNLSLQEAARPRFILLLLVQSVLTLALNRCTRRTTLLAGCGLLIMCIFLSLGIVHQARSLFAPGFLWFPVMMMPNFLLCGRRLGLLVSLLMIAISAALILYCRRFGMVLPFGNDPLTSMRATALTLICTNVLCVGTVVIYFFLLHFVEKKREEQRSWVQRTARMQELLLMSRHFALQTNGPLDVLGTALHNLEDPLRNRMQPHSLLPLLEPLESSIRDLAAVARSFSLFSRRYQEEGWEQTSVNAIFQHVDMIYNVGAALRKARLKWTRIEPDIIIQTQTAKLVMLLISILRGMGSEGGTDLQATMRMESGGLMIALKFKAAPPLSRAPRSAAAPNSDQAYDPELNEDLIKELCSELNIRQTQAREGDRLVYRLQLEQDTRSPQVA